MFSTVFQLVVMIAITAIGIKYLRDMLRYAKGYEINGKCRYGKAYAKALEASENSLPDSAAPCGNSSIPDFA